MTGDNVEFVCLVVLASIVGALLVIVVAAAARMFA